MKYKLKENIIRTVLLCGIWLIENIQNIESYGKADTGAKYNQFILDYICNPYEIIGIIAGAIFIFSLHSILKRNNEAVILRNGKDKYIKKEISTAVAEAIVFSVEYTCVNIVLSLIFAKADILKRVNLLLFSATFIVALSAFFGFVGIFAIFLKLICNFKSYYMYLEILIFVALYSLTAFDINIMPSLTTAYASLWFSQGEFDAAQYISTIISVCLVSAAVYIINRLIFGKKDIILNEK